LFVGSTPSTDALWPEEIKDVEAAFRSMDVAYHMNHRLNGAPMFDVQAGAMAEGIGHFRCTRVGKRRIELPRIGRNTAMAPREERTCRLGIFPLPLP
jgi:hypothetical protein